MGDDGAFGFVIIAALGYVLLAMSWTLVSSIIEDRRCTKLGRVILSGYCARADAILEM